MCSQTSDFLQVLYRVCAKTLHVLLVQFHVVKNTKQSLILFDVNELFNTQVLLIHNATHETKIVLELSHQVEFFHCVKTYIKKHEYCH